MTVCQTFIEGQQGAGKTTLARHLVRPAARVVACDMLHDYPEIPGAESFGEFAAAYRGVWPGRFKLAIRAADPAEHLAALRLVYRTQEEAARAGMRPPPIAVLIEETSLFTQARSMPEVLSWISTKGRHFNLSYVVVAQRGTQVPPMLGTNADVVVAMHTRREDAVLAECFTREERERIRTLRKVAADPDLRLGDPPVAGRNFLTDPPDVDVYARFRAATQG